MVYRTTLKLYVFLYSLGFGIADEFFRPVRFFKRRWPENPLQDCKPDKVAIFFCMN